MIFARDDIAWVQMADGSLRPLDAEGLARRIGAATARCGRADGWLVEAVAAALHEFVCCGLPYRVIAERELDRLTVLVLATLGYGELAAAYGQHHFSQQIRLDELAVRSGSGFELEFFRQLDVALAAAADSDALAVQMRGLRACVMQLRGARHWSPACRRLAEEIVSHVRHRLAGFDPHRTAAVRLLIGG